MNTYTILGIIAWLIIWYMIPPYTTFKTGDWLLCKDREVAVVLWTTERMILTKNKIYNKNECDVFTSLAHE